MIGATLGTFVDGVVIANALDGNSVAAIGLAMPVTIIIISCAAIFASGFSSVAGKLMGQGKQEEVNSVLTFSVLTALFIGFIFTVAILLFTEEIVTILNANGEVFELTVQYLRGFAPGIVFVMLGPVLISSMQIVHEEKRSVASTTSMLMTDIIGDLLVGYVFHAGMFGMGIATSLANASTTVVILLYFTKKNRSLKFSFKKFSLRDVGKIIIAGAPTSLATLCNAIRNIVLNMILLSLGGGVILVAFSSLNMLAPLVMSCVNGFGISTILIVSMIYGEENRRSLHHVFGKILGFGVLISSLVAVVLIIFAYPLSLVFSSKSGPEVAELFIYILRVFSLSIPLLMINKLLMSFYQSTGKIVLANVVCVLENIFFTLIWAYFLSGKIGANGVWFSFFLGEASMLVTTALIVFVRNRKLPLSLYNYLLISKTFGVEYDNRLNLTATNIDEAIGISERIVEFCNERGVNKRQANACGLCMEELAIAAFSEENCEENIYLDAYVIKKNDKLLMRLRYNGRLIDPTTYRNEELNPAGVGIKLVRKMCSEIKYSIILGYNIINISI